MEQFLQDLESSLGVPAELLERAAEARADAAGSSAENVVRSWAGVGDAAPAVAPEVSPAAPTPEPVAAAVAATPEPVTPVAAVPATTSAGPPEELLSDLESSLEVPVELLERAAAARGAASGISAESVVRSWAGVDAAPAAAPQPAAPVAAEPAPAAPAPAAATPAPAAESGGLGIEVLEAEPIAEVLEAEDVAEESVGALAGFPGWLSAALLAIPILALSYVLIAPNGPGCGSSGQLAIDAETGLAENCDGTEYGVDATSFFTIGADVYAGAGKCAGCHGDDGGGGTGPAFNGGAVLVTFPTGSCADHITWVAIGTDDWPEATYGANNTPVGGASASMPGFGEELSPEDLAAVVIYERVAFGGQPLADAEADCGTAEFEIAGG